MEPPSASQNGKTALAPRQCSRHGRAARPGWTFQIGGLRNSMGQTLMPSLRKARSARGQRVGGARALYPGWSWLTRSR